MRRLTIVFILLSLPFFAFAQEDKLSQTFTALDESIMFNYPDEWFAKDGNTYARSVVVLSNSESWLDLRNYFYPLELVVPSGDQFLIVWRPSTLAQFDFPKNLSFAELTTAMADSFGQQASAEVSEPIEITIGKHEAMMSQLDAEGFSAGLILVDLDGTYLLATAYTAPGEYAVFSPLVDSVLNTLTYTPPAEGATMAFISRDNTLSFEYPVNWIAVDLDERGIQLASSRDVYISREPLEGSVTFAVLTSNALIKTYGISNPEFDENTIKQLMDSWLDSDFDGEIENTTIGEYPALTALASTDLAENYMVLLDIGNQVLVIRIETYAHEYENWADTIEALLDSIQVIE